MIEFFKWEKRFPNNSSFNYPTKERDWNSYPYKLKGLAKELMYSHYEREVSDYVDNGVYAYELIKTDGRNWTYKDGKIVSNGPTRKVFLLWSDKDSLTIDFSPYIRGEMNCVNGLTGETTIQGSHNLSVSEIPIICDKIE